MTDTRKLLKRFYENYDGDKIRTAYSAINTGLIQQLIRGSELLETKINMEKGRLIMKIIPGSAVPAEILTFVGFFFDNYNYEQNYVWTNTERNIMKLFLYGFDRLRKFGAKIAFEIDSAGIQRIVHIMSSASYSDELLNLRLCENFKLLEMLGWQEYCDKIKKEVDEERDNAHISEVTSMDLPLDWNNAFSGDERAEGVLAGSASDGLILSVNNLGRVDIEYISEITRLKPKDVISELKGSIYQDPNVWGECFYKGWETADEYLSGRVRDKLKAAREANIKYKGYFSDNVNALEKIIPKEISANDIYVTLGTPWVPTDIIDEFIIYLLGYCHLSDSQKCKTQHDINNSLWKIPYKSRYKGKIKSSTTYGTKSIEALDIIEHTLNMRPIIITKEIPCSDSKSGKKRVINRQETTLALEKERIITEEFQKWIWQDEDRKRRLEKIYDETYGSEVVRHYDGSFLSFPEMSKNEKLFAYQKNAVARIIFSPNTLLAHEVGSGKTFVMIAAGMEMRRIGISKKNMYVVPNNIIGQWKDIFKRLYPDANLLCVEPSHFRPDKREKVIETIKNSDYDAVIIAYSCFGMIPISKQYRIDSITQEIAELNKLIEENLLVDKLKSDINKLSEELDELIHSDDDLDGRTCFDDLGINTLFVDEAHNYKNLKIETKIRNVSGISTSGSVKCKDMHEKVRIVQKQNDGRGAVFATGTPISNSLTDVYVMQKYLQFGELALLGLKNFDSWVGMFAEKESQVEVCVDTNRFDFKTKFSKFHNLAELSCLLASIADFHSLDKQNEIPDFSGYNDDVSQKTKELKDYLQDISNRADIVHMHAVSPKIDNMLKITSDGRKAALDIRLVDKNGIFSYDSKASHCAENVMKIYRLTEKQKSTQLIFCDTSIPKSEFNMYDEIKSLLIGMGADEKEIAFIHDAESERERNELFSNVQSGKIRILIGSTFKLGMGVNVQKKLCAVHHLDVPWRPADMVQREGRILRRGNENEKVKIYRYITEGSFDAYSWQLLESKQKVISNILSGCMSMNSCDDIDLAVLDYGEVKALAIGNPLLKERVECVNELLRCSILQRKLNETKTSLEAEKLGTAGKIDNLNQMIGNAKADGLFVKDNAFAYTTKERAKLCDDIFAALEANELCDKETDVFSYRGFNIILPAGMLKSKPFLYIERDGRYRIERITEKSRILTKIDDFMGNFDKYIEKLESKRENILKRQSDIEEELSRKECYTDKIQKLKEKIEEIDKKIGVRK